MLCTALAVPLSHAGRTVGVLSVYALQPDAFTSDNPNVLQVSAHQLGDVIGEKLHTEQSQHGSRASEWRNCRRNAIKLPIRSHLSKINQLESKRALGFSLSGSDSANLFTTRLIQLL